MARCLLGAANGQQRPRAELPIPREASSATACRPSPPCRALARGRGRATPVTYALATYVGPAAGRGRAGAGRAGAGRWLPLPATRARSAMWRGANGRRAGPRPPRPGRERVSAATHATLGSACIHGHPPTTAHRLILSYPLQGRCASGFIRVDAEEEERRERQEWLVCHDPTTLAVLICQKNLILVLYYI